MNRLALTWMLLLASGFLACGEIHAQARSPVSRTPKVQVQSVTPSDPAARARKRDELEVWLRRLVGKFQVKGTVMRVLSDGSRASRAMKGIMECARIGEGPGLQCLIKASWPPILTQEGRSGGSGGGRPEFSEMYNTLNPAMLVFALDPDDLEIKALLVDDHGIADDLSGVLTGDTVELVSGRKGCWGSLSSPRCPWGLGITAKPGSNVINVQTSMRNNAASIEFQLSRESQSKDQ